MERLKHMKSCLMACVESQMAHLDKVDTKELGEAIDMIKDLEEAIYYCTITKAMEGQDKEKEWMHNKWSSHEGQQYYSDGMMYYDERYPMMKENGRNYYSNGNGGNSSSTGNGGNGGGRNYYSDGNNNYGNMSDNEMQGRSEKSRRQYMESKTAHKDKATQLKELEKYMQELSADILEMIEESSPEEKQYLSKKMAGLADKVGKLN